MRKITVEGIEINFNDLTADKQMELYEKNKQKYKEDAGKSIYSAIRIMVVRDEDESSEFLNRVLRNEINGMNRIIDINVADEIFNNKIFEIEEETIKVLSESNYRYCRQKIGEMSKDSSFLNQMLRKEIKNWNDTSVERAIYKNKAFEIEEETIKVLSESEDWTYRQKAGEMSKDSIFLNQMLRKEIEDWQDADVENAIYKNKAFEIEEETIKVLSESDDWGCREKAAELSKDSSFLNQMLRSEIENWQDEDVEDAIYNNEAFEIEEETIKALSESNIGDYRKKAAKLLKDTNALLGMFINELKEDDGDFEVFMEIIQNDAFLFEKEALLKYIQDNYQ